MIDGESWKEVRNTGRWPCGVCGRGVGRNSVQCTSTNYQKWLHTKCGMQGSMFRVSKSFECTDQQARTNVDAGDDVSLELVDKLDMVHATNHHCNILTAVYLWSHYVIGQTIIW